jgi:hypothetical protein
MCKRKTAMVLVSVLGIAGPALAATPRFEDLDKDKDGKLSRSEAAAVEGLDFAKADSNKNGTIERSEYQAAVG